MLGESCLGLKLEKGGKPASLSRALFFAEFMRQKAGRRLFAVAARQSEKMKT